MPPEALIGSRLLSTYRSEVLPRICEDGDDLNHGSTALQDLHCLQTMSTRIYYGLFVAESKYRTELEKATALIEAQDRDGLMAFITKPEVEVRNIQRVILKAKAFSQDIGQPPTANPLFSHRLCLTWLWAGPVASGDPSQLNAEGATYKVDAEFVGQVFRDYIMPLTKDVEVDYLLQRQKLGAHMPM